MSITPLKSLIITAVLGCAVALGSGANANAAAPVSTAGNTIGNQSLLMQVDYRGHRKNVRKKHRGPACSVKSARSKASRMGIRNARVIQRGKTVQVRGTRHGRSARVTFANRRGCPTVR